MTCPVKVPQLVALIDSVVQDTLQQIILEKLRLTTMAKRALKSMKISLMRPAAPKTQKTADKQRDVNKQFMRSWTKQHPRLGGSIPASVRVQRLPPLSLSCPAHSFLSVSVGFPEGYEGGRPQEEAEVQQA